MRRATQMLLAMSAVVSATGMAGASTIVAVNFGGESVSVIDGDTLTELARIPVGVRPMGVAIHPSGRLAYVGNRNDNTVSVIDLESFTLIETLPVPGAMGMAMHPDGSRLYASNGVFSVVDTETNTVVTTLNFHASGIAMHPDGSRVYAADPGNGALTVIDTATNTVITRVLLAANTAWGVTVHPDGQTAYVVDSPLGAEGVVWVVDLVTNTLTTTIRNLPGSTDVAVHPTGRWLYVTLRDSGRLVVIDTETNEIAAEITGLLRPQGLAVDPNGRWVYVGNRTDALIVIDTETNTVVDRVPTGQDHVGIAVFGSSCDLDLVSDPSVDCNGNGTPDECELAFDDCNANGVLDTCELDAGTSTDINGDGTLDECQPQVTQLMDGAAGSFDATGATFISPHAESVPLAGFTLQATEDLELLSVQSTYTGKISGGRRGAGLTRVPTVTDFVSLGGGQHQIQIDPAPVPGEWLKLTLHVRGVSPSSAKVSIWLAHHPGDLNQDGVVDVQDSTAFGELFRTGASPLVVDLNGDGVVNVRDATTFGNLWHGRGGASQPWNGHRLPDRPE